uniref:Uncharacterized protein n=1 Tax=Tanacetum cinerariifolium TaxID=118510 RepID=A0A6L2KCA5_TANCI|nr:hypothetical protein [Tanacetum cinerariifolium]
MGVNNTDMLQKVVGQQVSANAVSVGMVVRSINDSPKEPERPSKEDERLRGKLGNPASLEHWITTGFEGW